MLYYSHVPAIIISLLIGFFVYIKNRTLLIGKILLILSLVFSTWTFINLITWTDNSSEPIMIVWSFFGILYVLLCMLLLYFAYVFIDKKDISFRVKSILGIILLPVILFAPTAYNIHFFSTTLCGAINEGVYYANYYYGVGFLMFLWILVLLIARYRKAEVEMKKQIIYLGIGIEFFLLSFFATGYISSLLTENSYNLEFYGLFGMTFFMGMLAFMIVKFKAFNIKLLGAQALVVSLVLLIGSQFFFIQNNTNRILTGITLFIAGIFGVFLVKSVKVEVRQREALEVANKKIEGQRAQLQITADQLAVANVKLKELDQAKTDFISLANHQLKHAPTPIKGYLSMVLDGDYGELSDKIKDVLRKVYEANERQIHLADDLLAVTRMESGKAQLDIKPNHIEEVLQSIYDNTLTSAREKGLELEFKTPKKALPEISFDKSKVSEAIFNFVDNAIKYTPSGKVTLKAELAASTNYKLNPLNEEEKAIVGSVIRVTVLDTGAGLSKDSIGHLFAKFSRTDVAKQNADGTGLGLYLVKLMIEAHGGHTWAESKGEGKGSSFVIELPIGRVIEKTA